MKNNIRYLKYRIRSQLPYTLIVTVLSALFTLSNAVSTTTDLDGNVDTYITLFPITLIICGLSFFTPIVELGIFKKRSDLDSLFSLPIERRSLLGIHLLSGLITNCIAITVSVLIVAIQTVGIVEPFRILILLPYWLCAMIGGALLFGFFSFLFYEGNTSADGIIFAIAHTSILQVFFSGIFFVLSFLNVDLSRSPDFIGHLSPFVPISWISEYFCSVLYPVASEWDFLAWDYGISSLEFILIPLLYAILSIAAIVAFFRWSVNKRIEKTGEISDSIFGYRSLLPMTLFTLFSVCAMATPLIVLSLIVAVGGYAIYRRSFRLKLRDWFTIGGFAVYSIIFSIILLILYHE